MPKFYLTTAIDYSNGEPHLGHALEKIGADCIARYRRLAGDDVHFLMGMDEHGQKVALAAEQAGLPPQAWVDRIAETFERTWRRLGCSHTDWIRTTEPRHVRSVTSFIERIRQHHPEDLYEGEYEGLYCVGCEEFKTAAQIANGRCVEHPTLDLVPTRERNYFFRLSRYTAELRRRIGSGEFRIEPEIRRNEILSLLEQGLEDVSVSRARFPWGIPFPGAPDHTVYVWFDALINYLTATGFPAPGYERLWPADLHVIGKGITRLHCCLWPAMLRSAELPWPRMVYAHGYVQWGGAKVSKSAGGALSVDEAIERHGPDALRYFLLREVGFEHDGDFTWERFDARYTADLADTVGNLVSRTLAMVRRYRRGAVPPSAETPLDRAAGARIAEYRAAMDAYRLHEGAAAAVALAAQANRYVQESAPWTLAKEGREAELDPVLGSLVRTVARLAVLLAPFMPAKAEEVWQVLGTGRPLAAVRLGDLETPLPEGAQVGEPPILFPKLQPARRRPATA
ncbi:MAG TPA: class I tRNA ligase family protein [Gemmatimonadales bacterium]|nr:class I tRNA ligase family protein [Gemmatimonadales bacterium]